MNTAKLGWSRRRVFVWAAAAAGALLIGACGALLPRSPVPTLRVVTYNIQYGGGGQNLDSIIGVIRTADASIVALQEVDVHWSARSGFADQATDIARALGMHVRFAPIYSIADSTGDRPPRQFGVALLSRHPITGFANRPLTRLSTQETTPAPRLQPGLLEARVAVGGRTVRVFNTHLDYRADPAVRRQQVAEMIGYIAEDTTTPTLLLGDLNASPGAPELQPLLAILRDSWPVTQGPGHTIPSAAPDKRIDYVLVSPGMAVLDAWVPATTASDHRPVVVELRVSR